MKTITKKIILLAAILSFLMLVSPVRAQLVEQIVPLNLNLSGDVYEGNLFITPIFLSAEDDYPSALGIMDAVGNPVFYKPMTSQSSGPYSNIRVSDFKLQPSGLLSYSAPIPGSVGYLYLLDSNFVLVDSISCTGDVETDGHDFFHLPDGTYHLVGTEERIMDCSDLVTADGLPGSENAVVTGNVIQRFDAQKNLVYEWKSLDYFALDEVYSHFFMDPNVLDHSHYNSLDIDDDGNYILSFRHLHEITKVNAETGEIMWRLGGKANQFELLGDTMPFSAQHDARRIENGNLTLFDNGAFNSTPVARAMEYELDEINFTATVVWQYAEPNGLSSMFIGSTQRLPNGNTLIDWGGAFPLDLSIAFLELDANGNVAMELDFIPDTYLSYRALKFDLPFTIHRPEIECDNVFMTLSAPAGYESYEWNTGSTAQSISVVDTGTYQVWVNQGIGYVSSEPFYVENLEYICGTTEIAQHPDQVVKIWPNPVGNKIYIRCDAQIRELEIFDLLGSSVVKINGHTENIDCSLLKPGMYTLKVSFVNGEVNILKLLKD